MGFFNRNKNTNDDEYLLILGEIRDNLKLNNDDVIVELENRISEAKHENLEEVGVLASKVKTLEKITKLQSTQIDESYKIIDKLESKVNELVGVVEKYTEIIKILTEDKPKSTIQTKNKKRAGCKDANPNHIRKCKCYGNVNSENIGSLEKDGRFRRKVKTKGGFYFNWNINDLLLIKSLIPKTTEYLSITSITSKVKRFSSTTINDLIFLIEDGFFDKYFVEWEQIQADKTYKKGWKQQIQNNPEKRKELGIYG